MSLASIPTTTTTIPQYWRTGAAYHVAVCCRIASENTLRKAIVGADGKKKQRRASGLICEGQSAGLESAAYPDGEGEDRGA
jgi:hypothetical protein